MSQPDTCPLESKKKKYACANLHEQQKCTGLPIKLELNIITTMLSSQTVSALTRKVLFIPNGD